MTSHHQGLGDTDHRIVIIRVSIEPPQETGTDTQSDNSGVASLPSWGGISVSEWKRKAACDMRTRKDVINTVRNIVVEGRLG